MEFTESIFDFPHNTNVQVIKKGLPIHIDFGRKYAYNFIIETGGDDVKTCFYNRTDFYYDENNKLRPKNAFSTIEEICIPAMQWHKINVSTPHNVINIEKIRISLTVTEKIKEKL